MNRFCQPGPPADQDVLLVALTRGGETWVVKYTERDTLRATWQLGRWAADPDLAFTWRDAAMMAMRIYQGVR